MKCINRDVMEMVLTRTYYSEMEIKNRKKKKGKKEGCAKPKKTRKNTNPKRKNQN